MIRYPIEYRLEPREIEIGTHWLSATLKNIGEETLSRADVKLNSLDAYGLGVFGGGSYLPSLDPQQEVTLPFRVSGNFTTEVYLSLDGWTDGASYHWESPAIEIEVGKEAARLTSLFAMTEPYPVIGETIHFEATLRGVIARQQGLTLEFLADTPGGEFQEMGTIHTKPLEAGEEVRYSAEILPRDTGMYTVYAYLYDGVKRLGRRVAHLYVRGE